MVHWVWYLIWQTVTRPIPRNTSGLLRGRIAALHDWRKLEMVEKGQRKVRRHPLYQDKGHSNAWKAFIDALQGGKEPPIPYKQIIGDTLASFAALESLRENKPVRINF